MVPVRRHVLIIEDQRLVALEIAEALLDLGFLTFDIADNAEDALACARRRRPDLITADYQIRGGTGAEALRGVLGQVGAVPTIFLTGDRDADWGLQGVQVFKPMTLWALTVACQSLGLD